MMAAEVSTPDAASLASSIFIVDEGDYQEEPLVKVAKFDGNEAKYRCGCCCHVWVCTLLVGVVELILLVLNLIFTAAAYGAENDNANNVGLSILLYLRSERSLVAGVLGALIGFLVVGLLIHGVLKQRHRFLLPHLALQLLAILTSIVMIVLFALSSASMSRRLEYENRTAAQKEDWTYAEKLFDRRLAYRQCVSISVLLTCITVLQGSFFVAVSRCYFYLREVRRRADSACYMPMVAVKGGVPNA